MLNPPPVRYPASHEPTWQAQLRDALRNVGELEAAGFDVPASARGEDAFSFRIPRNYAALFDRDDLAQCPLFRQAAPSPLERDPALPGWAQQLSLRATGREQPWHADSIGDVAHLVAPRLTHRYRHRAILHTTLACALYCRFCFRKEHMAQKEPALYRGGFAPALAYIARHSEINEVILTGGDPLSLSDHALAQLVGALGEIEHVRTVRLHSRMLGVLPARITPQLIAALEARPESMQIVVVAHISHPRELTAQAIDALQQLRAAGITLLHQTVLLRGVNDDPETLASLYTTLYQNGCLPYYLHHPDWTPSTFGFRVTIARGRALVAALVGRLSGPAVPTYVLDLPGGAGKVRLCDAGATPLTGSENHGQDERLVGQLWQFVAPHTRAKDPPKPQIYLDLAPQAQLGRLDDQPA